MVQNLKHTWSISGQIKKCKELKTQKDYGVGFFGLSEHKGIFKSDQQPNWMVGLCKINKVTFTSNSVIICSFTSL